MFLLDANIVLRYLNGDGGDLYEKSQEIIYSLELGESQGIIPNYIIMEILFVMMGYYDVSRSDITTDMRKIIAMRGIVNEDKAELLEALFLYESQNIDFADALLIAENRISGTEVISFDKKVNTLIGI